MKKEHNGHFEYRQLADEKSYNLNNNRRFLFTSLIEMTTERLLLKKSMI